LDFLRRNKDAPCFVNLWLDDVHSPWIPSADVYQEKEKNVLKNLKPVIVEMDRQIGRLMDGIQQLGLDENTIVIFASDNGPYPHIPGRTNGVRGCKFSLYEGGIRLPFIVRWPGVTPAGRTDDTTVISSVDTLPTLCRIATAELPSGINFDGIDCSQALRGEPMTERERPLMWEYGRNQQFFGYPRQARDRSPQLAIREGKWKLLCNADGQGVELYDLSTGPEDGKGIAEEHPDVAARLQKELIAWWASLP
jgi:arylsulfatase A-like enzyme